MTPNETVFRIALKNRITRRAWRTFARAVLTFGFLWAVCIAILEALN